ncbi:MAG TPA: peroxiredoxin [Rhodospirillaceae bacterium]|nr:peroxiredoxin [Rhodospirillaceae bacterium]MAX64492.1 peroxiredoxin [Rhodospirillaceae bacterium]MBB58399.1 peroxiredoxin [Rhodospirillaceae bacterium]HAE03124.1 peroxiredoxin [Rhodospirillaceae bacterium]HAJ20573.1 peroxiredoxin [Rhodospirillaceae bacterium]|tara:strand:+ start:497 stop:979 length:483 start_codon:yes stop_codon:yes gene_type:complete
MSIQEGEKVPAIALKKMGTNGPEDVDTAKYFAGSKVVLFSVPGAFTPTCSAKHVPGFVQNADALKAKGVDKIACLAVNDAFVMGAWGKDQGAGDKVDMLADGSAAFTKALGLELDLIAAGLGVRGQRFAMVVDDGTVTHLAVEAPGAFEVSSAEAILKAL